MSTKIIAAHVANLSMNLVAGLEDLARYEDLDLETQEGREGLRTVILDSLTYILPAGREAFESGEEFEVASSEVSSIVTGIADLVTAIEWSL